MQINIAFIFVFLILLVKFTLIAFDNSIKPFLEIFTPYLVIFVFSYCQSVTADTVRAGIPLKYWTMPYFMSTVDIHLV